MDRFGNFIVTPIKTGLSIDVLRSQEKRKYLFIVNTHATGTLYLGVGHMPSASFGVPVYPHGGFYEPTYVPENDLFIVADTVDTTGLLYIIAA